MGGRGAIHLGLAAASLLVIAAAPARAASCAHGDDLVAGLSSADRRAALVCVIGSARGAHGLAPVRENGLLTLAAQRHADDMVARGYFAHVTPDGASVTDRVRQTGYLGGAHDWTLGEDIGWGTGSASTPASIFRAFMNSPPHRRVILDRSFRQIGIGVAQGVPVAGQGAGATFVLDFGEVD
jgi:uncharacterized protein YkwD